MTLGKTLVVYFSTTGSTERIANLIATETGADTLALEPVQTYTDADLDWTDKGSRVTREHEHTEMQDEVELVQSVPDNWEAYDTVYVGYPIWWGNAAWPVNRFIADNDFTGKRVIPFYTLISSGLGESSKRIAEMAGTGDWAEGRRFSSNEDEEEVLGWVRALAK